jgi:hypothetical protein
MARRVELGIVAPEKIGLRGRCGVIAIEPGIDRFGGGIKAGLKKSRDGRIGRSIFEIRLKIREGDGRSECWHRLSVIVVGQNFAQKHKRRLRVQGIMKALKVLVIAALWLFTVPREGMAQSQWSLEILGGGNYRTLNPNVFLSSSGVPFAPVAAVGVNRMFSKNWAFDIRAEFIQRNVGENIMRSIEAPGVLFYTDTQNSHDIQELNYLEFPLTLRFGITIGAVRPFAFVGLAPGLFLSGHNHIIFWDSSYASKTSTTTDTIINAKGAVNSFLLSGVCGIGIIYRVTPSISLMLEGTYEASMANIPNGSLQPAVYSPNPYYLPSMTPLYTTNESAIDTHFELGISVTP